MLTDQLATYSWADHQIVSSPPLCNLPDESALLHPCSIDAGRNLPASVQYWPSTGAGQHWPSINSIPVCGPLWLLDKNVQHDWVMFTVSLNSTRAISTVVQGCATRNVQCILPLLLSCDYKYYWICQEVSECCSILA